MTRERYTKVNEWTADILNRLSGNSISEEAKLKIHDQLFAIYDETLGAEYARDNARRNDLAMEQYKAGRLARRIKQPFESNPWEKKEWTPTVKRRGQDWRDGWLDENYDLANGINNPEFAKLEEVA